MSISISQKTVGGNSCGACATSYVLEDLLNFIYTKGDIEKIWEKVAFESGVGNANLTASISGTTVPHSNSTAASLGLEAVHTDPTKLVNYLTSISKALKVQAYLKKGSDLDSAGLSAFCEDSSKIDDGDGLAKLQDGWWAITIVNNGAGFHYVPIKKTGVNSYSMMDSNEDPTPSLHKISTGGFPGVTTFQATGLGTWAPGGYKYLGGAVVVHK
jgi:hypothetical protein